MDGVEKESSLGAMYVNRLCNSQAWVKCLLNGFAIFIETRRKNLSLFFFSTVLLLFLQLNQSDSEIKVNYWM